MGGIDGKVLATVRGWMSLVEGLLSQIPSVVRVGGYIFPYQPNSAWRSLLIKQKCKHNTHETAEGSAVQLIASKNDKTSSPLQSLRMSPVCHLCTPTLSKLEPLLLIGLV